MGGDAAAAGLAAGGQVGGVPVQHSTIQYNTVQYRWAEYQPNLVYPLRVGTHTSTAFGLSFALDYTRSRGDELAGFEDLIKHNSSMFYLLDK